MNGQYAHNIDAKGRLIITTKHPDKLGGNLHNTFPQHHCLSNNSNEN